MKRPELTEEQKAILKADRATMKALVDKYDSEITSLLDEIETEREQWKEDMKAIEEKPMNEERLEEEKLLNNAIDSFTQIARKMNDER